MEFRNNNEKVLVYYYLIIKKIKKIQQTNSYTDAIDWARACMHACLHVHVCESVKACKECQGFNAEHL